MIYKAINKNINLASKLLLDGEIIVYPTDTLYGLGVDATNQEAINKINKLKNRIQPLSIIVDSFDMLNNFCLLNTQNKIDIKKYLPGPYTLLFNKKDNLPDLLTCDSKKIGIRIPKSNFAINLVKNINKPIVTTSVNIHSQYSLNSIDEISAKFSNLNIFSGEVNLKSKGSTIIDFTLNPYKTLRQGDGI
mgnify:CR=1 FL=1|tara:strand:+ start:451 stop:1020 length:570 start_codon:yes stop_codon:yes gene_type:complete